MELHQFPRHSSCNLCPLHAVARHVGIPTVPHLSSTGDTSLVFLGQNPGFQEDAKGIPFIGPSGRALKDAYIEGAGLASLARIYFANTARCYHVHGDGPAASVYKKCRPYLSLDLSLLPQPIVVVCLGAVAATHLFALCGVPKITLSSAFSRQGSRLSLPTPPLPSTEPVVVSGGSTGKAARLRGGNESGGDSQKPSIPITVFSTFHPAACLRERALIYAVQDHMVLVRSHLLAAAPVAVQPWFVPPIPPPD